MGRRTPVRGAHHNARSEAGQATVEFALVIPLFFALIALLVQVALVARDEVRVVNAARVATRAATVTADADEVSRAVQMSLPGARVRVVRRGRVGEPVEVEVAYVSPTDLPLVGALLPDLTLRGDAVMQVEK